MLSSKGAITIYMLPGQKYKITALSTYPETKPQPMPTGEGGSMAYEMKSLIHGFVVEDDSMGELESVANEPAVIYTQKKFGPNKVYYYALTGERATADIVSVPIHDHSSIVTGGPAYGTYFTDDETVDTSTGGNN